MAVRGPRRGAERAGIRWIHQDVNAYNHRWQRDFRGMRTFRSGSSYVGTPSLMSSFTHRSLLAVVWVSVATVAFAQGYVCAPPGSPSPVQPPTPAPSLPTVTAYVDPVLGNDATASPGGNAFKTIQAAVNALAQVTNTPSELGAVILMPGWYGYDPTDTRYNGEVWPVQVQPGIRIEGVNALNVIIDGGRQVPAPTTYTVPSPTTGVLTPRVPCFVMGGSLLYGYTYTLVNRVTIVDADIGVLVTGDGEIDGTVSETLFMNCAVGAQIHSTGGALDGVHRPRILWCTFGNCDVGLAMTAQTGPNLTPPRSFPAVVNTLFKNTVDLEGVPCHAVSASAFGATRVNQSTSIPQPAPDPTSAFDVDLYTHNDLFLGARSQVTQQQFAGQSESDWWFSDWRLTFVIAGGMTNPAQGPGVTTFPANTANGTTIDLSFGDYAIASESSEGLGTYGPLSGPYGGATGHIGYRAGGTFVVGGTVPGERRFGSSASGIMYNLLDIYWPPGTTPVVLFGIDPGNGPLYINGQKHARGVLPTAAALGPLLGFAGDAFLDYPAYSLTDWTSLTNGLGTSGVAQFDLTASLGLTNATQWTKHVVWQMACIDPFGIIVGSDAQPFSVGR